MNGTIDMGAFEYTAGTDPAAPTTSFNPTEAGKLSAYPVRDAGIRVIGKVGKQALATLYDIQGRVMLVKALDEGSFNVIPTTNLKPSVYLLRVKDLGKMQTFKVLVGE
jgi:hypothetical protein